jgi:crossover junction endodeoxyribonuclease RusA
MTTITLDYPPSSNRYWRVGDGRIYRSGVATAYKNYVGYICLSAGLEPAEGNVAITLRFYRPAQRGDLDNRLKICLDALQGYAYHNDSQIAEIHATRHEDRECPRVEVEVRSL